MYIRLDVFADMLGLRPGDLLHALRSTGQLDGLPLPARRQVRGAAVMFDQSEAIAFSHRWHARKPEPPAPSSGEPLMSVDAFAEQAGIAPLALWQAATTGKTLKGIPVPVAVKSCNGRLMFEPAAVAQFLQRYRAAAVRQR